MLTFDSNKEYFITEVAKACDLCLKPWRHSVFDNSPHVDLNSSSEKKIIDFTFRVESRSEDGQRFPDNDLEVEIFRSGVDLSITLSWASLPERPILWHGKHSIWMDASSGERCSQVPEGGSSLEALARRLRSSFFYGEDM